MRVMAGLVGRTVFRFMLGHILLSAAVSLTAVIGGIVVSLLLNLPTGAVIVMTNFALFLVAFGVRACRRRGRN